MILNLSEISSEALHRQVSRQIRAKILAGALKAGDDLPSIRGLAREYHISVITVQSAYDELQHAGLIHARRGKGFFVSDLTNRQRRKMALEGLEDKLRPIIRDALAEGLSAAEIQERITIILGETQ